MVEISTINPTEETISELKLKYPRMSLLKVSWMGNHFILRTITNIEFRTVSVKYNVDDEKELESLKAEFLKMGIVYPVNGGELVTDDNAPAGLVDTLYSRLLSISGYGGTIDVDLIHPGAPLPTEEDIVKLKKEYPNSVLVGVDTMAGYYIVKGITADDFYKIDAMRQKMLMDPDVESSIDKQVEANLNIDLKIMESSLVWPRGAGFISDMPAGVMNELAGYIMEASGFGEVEVEVIE